jgi:hypothetical protein
LKSVSTGGKVVPQAQYVGENNRIIVLFVPQVRNVYFPLHVLRTYGTP